MSVGNAPLWPRRLRWRLLGAWRWPLFVVVTIVEGVIVHALPPTGAHFELVPAIVICSFANLFLVGVIAPWLARRLAARQGQAAPAPTFPPAAHSELLVDRIAAITLLLGLVGVLLAGIGNHKVVVAVTDRVARGGEAARAYVLAHAPTEVRVRVDAMDTHLLEQRGLFRMCVPYDDPRRAYCMYVDAGRRPPTVRKDGDTRPNGELFPTSGSGF